MNVSGIRKITATPHHEQAKPVERFFRTLEFYIEQLEKYIDKYNNTAHHGDGMDEKTPNQVYFENITEIREIADSNSDLQPRRFGNVLHI